MKDLICEDIREIFRIQERRRRRALSFWTLVEYEFFIKRASIIVGTDIN